MSCRNVNSIAPPRGQAQKPGKRARHGYHTQIDLGGGFFPAAQQECHTERLVQYTWKRMGRIHRHGSQNRLDLFGIKLLHDFLCVGIQFIDLSHANGFSGESWNEFLPPAGVLVLHEFLQFRGELRKQFTRREAIGPDFSTVLLSLLEEPGYADFDKFIEIAGRYRQKFHAFEQRIARVGSFFEHAAVKLQPG
jgi:hypothetical protein